MAFNSEQQQALDCPGNVVVSAGAGSGKTRVLVEKYFRLLVEEQPTWPVDRVVAITFTKKAAAELKSRIVLRIEQELKEPVDPYREERLIQLRNEIPWAPIGTIHNLCIRILRENAFEIRLNPDFAIVEGAPAAAFAAEAIRNVLVQAVDQVDELPADDLLTLLSVFKQLTLEKELLAMLWKRADLLEPARNFSEKDTDQLFEELKQFHEDCRLDPPAGCIAAIYQAMLALQGIAVGKLAEEVAGLLDQWPAGGGEAAWKECALCVVSISERLFTLKMTVRSALFKNTEIDDTHPDIENLAKQIHIAKQFLPEPLQEMDRQNLEICQCLCRTFLRVVQEYAMLRSASKTVQESDFLDFSDLELKTRELLRSSAEARTRLRQEFRYLIIDEFQDTSEIQWEILSTLVTNEAGNLMPARLFVVGDQKQGIYGFRNANVSLFQSVRNMVQQSNNESNVPSGLVSMQRNYRTSRLPLAVINQIFQQVLGQSDSAEQVSFEPLLCRSEAPMGELKVFVLPLQDDSETQDETPEASSDMEQNDDDGESVLEADKIADYVAGLVNSGTPPSEIAILFRKRKYFSDYQAALEQRGIACSVQRIGQLFLKREIIDVLAPLHVALNPYDDTRVLSYLRSSLVNLTDDLLLKIALRQEDSLWEKCLAASRDRQWMMNSEEIALDDIEMGTIKSAVGLIAELSPRINLVPIGNLLDLEYDYTGARIVMAADSGWSNGRRMGGGHASVQALSNLDKLLSIARKNESMTLQEFLEFVEDERAVDTGEEEASLDMDVSAGVRIMTIHASKGLEFDVVILPQLNDLIRPRGTSLLTDGKKWIAIQLGAEFRDKKKIFLHRYLNDLGLRRAADEERRVLYVAMTRCRHTLVLSAAMRKKEGNSFYQWIKDLLNDQAARNWGFDDPDKSELRTVNSPISNSATANQDHQDSSNYFDDSLYRKLAACPDLCEPTNEAVGMQTPVTVDEMFVATNFEYRRKMVKQGLLYLSVQGNEPDLSAVFAGLESMPESDIFEEASLKDIAAAVLRGGKMLESQEFHVALQPAIVRRRDGASDVFLPDAVRYSTVPEWVYLILDKNDADLVHKRARAHLDALKKANATDQVFTWELTGQVSLEESKGAVPKQLDLF